MREYTIGLLCVPHVLLNSKVVHAQIEVQRGRHANRAKVRSSMRAGKHVKHFREVRNFPQVTDSASVHNSRSDVVDQLFADQRLAVENRVEYFANCERSRGVLTYQPETLLQFCRHRVFHPEQAVGFKALAQSRRLYRGEPMMDIVKQMQLWTKLAPKPLEQVRNKVQVVLAAPDILGRQTLFRGFVVQLAASDAIGAREARNPGLRPHRLIAELDVASYSACCLIYVRTIGVPVDHHRLARSAAQQLIDRRIDALALYVPK